jgi:putative photosynthetic complex assembly protein 2
MATLTQYALPVLVTLLVWWAATGIVLLAVNRRRTTYPWSLGLATLTLAGALAGLSRVGDEASVMGVYLSFACGILIWSWVEITYYTGVVTGPRPRACPDGVGGGRRFWLALQASLYHEVAILALAGLCLWLTWDAENQVGTWTFVILWLMRWSAKLNIFLGVPHLNLQWFPEHLRYLESFIVRRPMNPLFPLSIAGSLVSAGLVLSALSRGDATPVEVATALLLGTLIVLAIIEHGFLVLPLRDSVLWNWALPGGTLPRDGRAPSTSGR